MLDICTQLTGDAEAYEEHGTAVQEQIDAARSRADGSAPTVLYVRGHRLQLQGEKQPGQRSGGDAGGSGLRQHCRQR